MHADKSKQPTRVLLSPARDWFRPQACDAVLANETEGEAHYARGLHRIPEKLTGVLTLLKVELTLSSSDK